MKLKLFTQHSIVILLTFYFLSLNYLCAQLKEPEKFFKETQEKYNQINNCIIEFTQEVKSPVIDEKQSIKGKLYYAKGNKYRIEFQNQLLVCDGVNVYNFTKPSRKVIISKFEENFYSPSNLLVNIVNFSKIEFFGEEKVNEKRLYKFNLIPKRNDPEFKTMILWIDSEKVIQKLETEDWAGNRYTFNVLNFKSNQSLKNDLFTFTIPAGVKVVDLR